MPNAHLSIVLLNGRAHTGVVGSLYASHRKENANRDLQYHRFQVDINAIRLLQDAPVHARPHMSFNERNDLSMT